VNEVVRPTDMVVEAAASAQLDERHAVRLRGEAAMNVRDGLARTTREGIRLGRRATAEPVARDQLQRNGSLSENRSSG
jgi:hypothetical protein